MKILTVIGARPQFIKAAMVSRAIFLSNSSGICPFIFEEIIHTGQHYDENMSDIFFKQMQIPEPVLNLRAGKGTHGEMTGRMLAQIEKEIFARQPDWVLVYGDTNSTLAGALAASKLNVPIAHVEAGMRSFNKRMPEEINRILTDHVSSLLFCPTKAAVSNLSNEGITVGVHHVGDVMFDAALAFANIAEKDSKILKILKLIPKKYCLATVHRAENTDNPARLHNILSALSEIEEPVIFPIHPRTRSRFVQLGLKPFGGKISLIDPVSFMDMVQLEKNARVILTDSGGVQKEAYFHGTPCVTLRDETEWVETIHSGWNQLAGDDKGKIKTSVINASKGSQITEYGTGNAATNIIKIFLTHCT